MGVSASSLLDEATSAYIKGQALSELKEFAPYYRKQFAVARFAQVEDKLEQNKEKITQLLRQKEAPEEAIVLYEEGVRYFDETRKWRERYVVVRANYSLECHESLQSYMKGAPSLYKLLPTGGTVLTTEESYMEMVNKCYPDDGVAGVKEEFAPPLPGMPGQFPVYLRLPYRRDSYFCFRQQAKQAAFISILSDCIKHQNQDFLKKKTCEVQAFLKAVQLYRQDRGRYQVWDMLIGSDVRVLANLVMEKLLPWLGKELLPRLKAKKTERKRLWFSMMEEAYFLVQEHLLAGLSALKEECRTSAQEQDFLMNSDMDQILNTRQQLEEKVRAKVSEPAERLCSESVQPYLGSVLEELMEPVSCGFLEGRQLIETKMDEVCRDVQQGTDNEKLKKALGEMARPNLLSCYEKIGSLQDKLKDLQERFDFSTITAMTHGAQIDLQQLVENAAYTFELMVKKAVEENAETAAGVIDKAKHRVLKQYDYDSSTVRKRIFQDALVSITLPFIKKNLADSCKAELQGLEQTIYADYSNFIHIENVYENILLQILDQEASRVVKEAASLKKHNLFTGNSHASLSSVSTPSTPTLAPASSVRASSQSPPSPLATNGLPLSGRKEKEAPQESETLMDAGGPEAELPAAEVEDAVRTLKAEGLETLVPPESGDAAEIQENRTSVQTEPETAAEPETRRADHQDEADTASSGPSAAAGGLAPEAANQPEKLSAEEPGPQPAASENTVQSLKAGGKLEAPSGGGEAEDVGLELKVETESLTASDPNSLDVSVGSESPRSELESTGGISETSELLQDVQTSVSPRERPEERPSAEEPSFEAQTQAVSRAGGVEAGGVEAGGVEAGGVEDGGVEAGGVEDGGVEIGAGAAVETAAEPAAAATGPPAGDGPAVQLPDCVKEIRDLVEEVIEVEQPVHHYPKEE